MAGETRAPSLKTAQIVVSFLLVSMIVFPIVVIFARPIEEPNAEQVKTAAREMIREAVTPLA